MARTGIVSWILLALWLFFATQVEAGGESRGEGRSKDRPQTRFDQSAPPTSPNEADQAETASSRRQRHL